MNLLIGEKHKFTIRCKELDFVYYYKDNFPVDGKFDCKIVGLKYGTNLIDFGDTKIALIDPQPGFDYNYLLIIGEHRTMAADLEKIRKSKKPVIAICDFDFLDDVERYLAAGAQVITFKELRRYNG